MAITLAAGQTRELSVEMVPIVAPPPAPIMLTAPQAKLAIAHGVCYTRTDPTAYQDCVTAQSYAWASTWSYWVGKGIYPACLLEGKTKMGQPVRDYIEQVLGIYITPIANLPRIDVTFRVVILEDGRPVPEGDIILSCLWEGATLEINTQGIAPATLILGQYHININIPNRNIFSHAYGDYCWRWIDKPQELLFEIPRWRIAAARPVPAWL